eukprot:scaffold18932_cov65-Phaeocystis_antarctica.AAC.2
MAARSTVAGYQLPSWIVCASGLRAKKSGGGLPAHCTGGVWSSCISLKLDRPAHSKKPSQKWPFLWSASHCTGRLISSSSPLRMARMKTSHVVDGGGDQNGFHRRSAREGGRRLWVWIPNRLGSAALVHSGRGSSACTASGLASGVAGRRATSENWPGANDIGAWRSNGVQGRKSTALPGSSRIRSRPAGRAPTPS